MMATKIFLDTCSILFALSGLKDKADFDLLRNKLEESNSGSYASHIQIDEKYPETQDFKQICRKAFDKFEEHGIKIHWEEATKGAIVGISRVGYCRISGDDLAGIDDELRRELEKCMNEEGKHKNLDKKAKILNIARDCLIALTSTDYDCFITSDKCLYKSCIKILQKNETKRILEKTPSIIYVQPEPEKMLREILKILNS